MTKALPQELLASLKNTPGFEKQPFIDVHESGEQVTSIRVNPFKPFSGSPGFDLSSAKKIPWTANGFYLDKRPSFTFDPLFHAGCYYVQEASGMFLEQAMKQTLDLDSDLRVLDLCAAPGGKSTHVLSMISPDSLLVSNEVIRGRGKILGDNLARWGCCNMLITHSDPRDFAALENYFDLVIVDAPCSGSGLFRRDPSAIDEWSAANVQLCCGRQQRILSDIIPSLKKNGILVYSTCSYSSEEDEDIAEWLLNNFPIESVNLKTEPEWSIVESQTSSGANSYRFWPHRLAGEGFFISVFRKTGGAEHSRLRKHGKIQLASNDETALVSSWIKTEGISLIRQDTGLAAIPISLTDDFTVLPGILKTGIAGTRIGQLMHGKLVPDHALALSRIISPDVPFTSLDYHECIRYLQKKELTSRPPTRGWQLVSFEGHPVGWINALPNRVNNYYPSSLRILKEEPTGGANKSSSL